ncbi:hypothetical protein GCM10010353_72570 [Streptomyces chryseus]|nr:hypothetical protein GCM10010353_72570 [Streptomyces chryseus]
MIRPHSKRAEGPEPPGRGPHLPTRTSGKPVAHEPDDRSAEPDLFRVTPMLTSTIAQDLSVQAVPPW